MSQQIRNILNDEDIAVILADPVVVEKRNKLNNDSNFICFHLNLPDTIRAKLSGLGISLSEQVPLRWIQGDTLEHADRGIQQFNKTHLIYVTDSAGKLCIGDEEYPLERGCGYVFGEGLRHSTKGAEPRLLIGPMSELGFQVGSPGINYCTDYHNALNSNSSEGFITFSFTVVSYSSWNSTTPTFPGFVGKNWKVGSYAVESTSYPIQDDIIYVPGDIIDQYGIDAYIYLYPIDAICFKQDTNILCQINGTEQYIPVQTMKKGTLVKTLKNKYVPVDIIGSGLVHNSGDGERILNRLYRLPKGNYPSLKEDLIMTGGHCSLIDIIPSFELRQKLIEKQGKIFTTEGKYRLPALVDEKAVPYEQKGVFKIWNFALENKEPNSNYGIYANGLLVESGFHKSIGKHLSIV
jgi:hypothetical protein